MPHDMVTTTMVPQTPTSTHIQAHEMPHGHHHNGQHADPDVALFAASLTVSGPDVSYRDNEVESSAQRLTFLAEAA